MLVGSIWLLVTAFQESILWGLGTLLVPFVGIIFVIMHWDAAKKPFLIWAAGFVPYVIGMILAASPECSSLGDSRQSRLSLRERIAFLPIEKQSSNN